MYDQNIQGGGGGRKGWLIGRGSSERCLKRGGGVGSLRDLSKNISKQGEGVLKVSLPLPPPPEIIHFLLIKIHYLIPIVNIFVVGK